MMLAISYPPSASLGRFISGIAVKCHFRHKGDPFLLGRPPWPLETIAMLKLSRPASHFRRERRILPKSLLDSLEEGYKVLVQGLCVDAKELI